MIITEKEGKILMRIFDNILLAQYIDVGAKVKVYANSEWYQIVDKSDVADKIDAIGYDEYGGDHRFSYQQIEQINVNGKIITLDMLSAKMGDKPTDDSKDSKPKEDKPDEETPDGPDLAPDDSDLEDLDSGGKKPDLSWFSPAYEIGRVILREKEMRKRKLGNKI